ncbi:MAG: alpha/beta hydrolase [Succinivibrio sp.]|nr:alpha/beta hydrolase [Succinivibrio sp.]
MAAEYAQSKLLEVTLTKNRIDLIPDITYAQVSVHSYPNVDLKLDLLRPRTGRHNPLVVFVTGGGFITSNRAGHLEVRMRLAEEGFTVASIEYRYAPQICLPAPIIDTKCAIRYLRKNAMRFGIDPLRIGIMGTSAGGYLASFAGVTGHSRLFDEGPNLDVSSRVACVVDVYGVSDLSRMAEGFDEHKQQEYASPSACQALWLNGCTICGGVDASVLERPEEVAKYNPVNYVDEHTPPFLIFHGSADTLVSPVQTDLMFQRLRQCGIPAERYLVKGAGHGGVHWVQNEVQDLIVAFFREHLQG